MKTLLVQVVGTAIFGTMILAVGAIIITVKIADWAEPNDQGE